MSQPLVAVTRAHADLQGLRTHSVPVSSFTAADLAERNGRLTPAQAEAILDGFERRAVVEHVGEGTYRLTPYGASLANAVAGLTVEATGA
jgi:hypothetical protein